ncbi:hypothetical protein K435DRAFT_69481 [Dendrothele bispora CBS 962.96]|uniref:FAD/NAD(P)-binding domain-containing protein n=1 Tax=Dendrothele bispora (strain CBS 962.96) TaxID=1314807 RepID=A0A4S8M5I8_DENBC|nr:hypothetical protein K435DRAFT_69481 [Dendrothele bispora CBS 962.96]
MTIGIFQSRGHIKNRGMGYPRVSTGLTPAAIMGLSLTWVATLLLALLLLLRHVTRRLRHHLLKKETAMLDWVLMGKAREEKNKIPGTAVICGGSLAGLLAARVCHDHFERVIIVEPEAWLSTEDGVQVESWKQKQKRARVVQYTSLHGNLAPITDGLIRLFPNLEKECHRSETRLMPADFKLALGGHKFLVPHEEYGASFPQTIGAGRQGTETLIRRLTLNTKEYPNISQISGLITGVRIDSKNPKFLESVQIQTEAGLKEIKASLVVDCTGPAQAGQEWIRSAGFAAGPKALDKLTVSYDPRVRYSSFRFQMPPEVSNKVPEYDEENATGGLFIYKGDPSVSQTYCGAMKIEADFVSVVCGAWGPAELPDTIEGIRECLKSTKSPTPIPEWIWKFIDLCEEVEDTMQLSKVRVAPSYWTHFESASDLPANWIASGDSVSRVNPVFGQGGTKSMMGAVSLNNVLQELHMSKTIPEDFSRRFFKDQAGKLAPLWTSNKMVDYAYKTTIPEQGETLETGAFIRWYLHKLEVLSDKDKQIGSMFWHNVHSYGTSIDALHPIFVWKVLVNTIFGK